MAKSIKYFIYYAVARHAGCEMGNGLYSILKKPALAFLKNRMLRFRPREGARNGKVALVSYIVHPFLPLSPVVHTNFMEAVNIRDVLISLGYVVDVCDYRCKRSNGDFVKYDLVVGFGSAFFDAVKAGVPCAINYSTGSASSHQSRGVREALVESMDAFGRLALLGFRYQEFDSDLQALVADKVILVGNNFTRTTYADAVRDIRCVPGIASFAYNSSLGWAELEPFELNRGRSVLWLGGAGCLHKGLDVVMSACERVSATLFVAGIRPEERALFRRLKARFVRLHVVDLGFINTQGLEWKKLARRIGIVSQISVSEGQSTAVLTAAAAGLYPITNRACGIDFGSVLEAQRSLRSSDMLADEMNAFFELSFEERVAKRVNACDIVYSQNSVDSHKRRFADALHEEG